MKLEVKVIAGASREAIVKESEKSWKIYLRESPERGKANDRLKELIAEELNIAKSKVVIVKGATTNRKLIEII